MLPIYLSRRSSAPGAFPTLLSVLGLLLFALTFLPGIGASAAPTGDALLVRFRDVPASADALRSPTNQRTLSRLSSIRSADTILPRAGIMRVRVGRGGLQAALAALRRDPNVLYAEPDYPVHALFSPNDPIYTAGSQWGLGKVSAPAAWDRTRGSSYVGIAILDSGVDPAHPDLASRLVSGYNVFDRTANTDDNYGHGTHVAGIAAGKTNNSLGIAGADHYSRIVPVKVLDNGGSGDYSGVIDGIRWATDRGVKVINMSLGGSEYSQALQDAVNYAWERGVVIVAAAGNAGNTGLAYPAAMNNVLSVAATDTNDARASFSNYGTTVDVAAPGNAITSTTPTHAFALEGYVGRNYGGLSGTSMASPLVAGQATLLFARSGLDTPPSVIVQAIKSTMDAVSDTTLPKIPGTTTPGRVNFDAALASLAANGYGSAPSRPVNLTATAGIGGVTLAWNFVASADTYVVRRATTSGGAYTIIASGVTATTYTDMSVTSGVRYYYVVSAVNANGESALSNEASAVPAGSLRINCGGGAYTAVDGRVFQADTYFTNGSAFSYPARDVLGTADDALYTDVRFTTTATTPPNFRYILPVASGSYTVKLHFAECYWTTANQRNADISINGTRVLTNFDMFTDAGGKDKALIKSFPVTVTGTGGVNVFVEATIGNPYVCAIEVESSTAAPAAPTSLTATAGHRQVSLAWSASASATSYTVKRATTSGGPYTSVATGVTATGFIDTGVTVNQAYYYVVTAVNASGESAPSNQASATPIVVLPIRINCGGGAYTAVDGRVFQADTYFTNGSAFSYPARDVLGTADDALYTDVRFTTTATTPPNFRYILPVASGSYTVKLHFAECYWTTANQRNADISINGTRVLTNFDMFTDAGGKDKALIKSFPVTVTGTGGVNVFVEATIGNPYVCAIELIPAP